MTVSMRLMTAGDGFWHLLESLAAGVGDRSPSPPPVLAASKRAAARAESCSLVARLQDDALAAAVQQFTAEEPARHARTLKEPGLRPIGLPFRKCLWRAR